LGTAFQYLLGFFHILPEIITRHLRIEDGDFRLGPVEIKDDLGVC